MYYNCHVTDPLILINFRKQYFFISLKNSAEQSYFPILYINIRLTRARKVYWKLYGTIQTIDVKSSLGKLVYWICVMDCRQRCVYSLLSSFAAVEIWIYEFLFTFFQLVILKVIEPTFCSHRVIFSLWTL